MDKKIINQELQAAYLAIKEFGIVNGKDEIERRFRSYVSSFGAAITMGSLLPAIAFLGKDDNRNKVQNAIFKVLKENEKVEENCASLFEYAQKEVKKNQEKSCQEEILNATIAVKLAMNLYKWIDNEEAS